MAEKPLTVLLVEDNLDDVHLLRRMLADGSSILFKITPVERLDEALQRLTTERFDMILLDLMLPDSRGSDTFLMVQAAAPEVPIVVLTGLNDETLAAKAVREGAQDYLVKGTINGPLLVRAIRYAIERKQTEIELKRLYQHAEQRRAILERLWSVGQVLNQSLALPVTLNWIVRVTHELFQANAALALWDPVTNRLTFTARSGSEPQPHRQTIRLGEGAMGIVVATRRPLIVNDYQTFPHRLPELTTHTAVMDVPLLVKGQLIGVLGVGTTEPGRTFTAEDLQLLELLAQPAAIALENARLYQELETSRDQLRALTVGILKAKEEEARRIAHALHDETGQLLASVYIALEKIGRTLSPPTRKLLQEVRGLLDQIEERFRHLSHELRPTVLDDLGLQPAIEFLTQGVSTRTGLSITIEGSIQGRLPSQLESVVRNVLKNEWEGVARKGNM